MAKEKNGRMRLARRWQKNIKNVSKEEDIKLFLGLLSNEDGKECG